MKKYQIEDEYNDKVTIETEEEVMERAYGLAKKMEDESDETYPVNSIEEAIDVLEAANLYVLELNVTHP